MSLAMCAVLQVAISLKFLKVIDGRGYNFKWVLYYLRRTNCWLPEGLGVGHGQNRGKGLRGTDF